MRVASTAPAPTLVDTMLWLPESAQPEPSEAVENQLRPLLKEWSELLDLLWYAPFRRYALIAYYPANDPMRERFQKGETDADYDILGWLTKGLQSADEIPKDPMELWPKIQELLASADNARVPWKQRLAQVAAKNQKLREQRNKDFLEGHVHDNASYVREAALGIPISHVSAKAKEIISNNNESKSS